MKRFLTLILVLGMVISLVSCGSETVANTGNATGESPAPTVGASKYKVGEVLEAPEKLASLKDFNLLTIHVEAEDSSYSETLSMKRNKNFCVFSGKMVIKDQPFPFQRVTYQIGEEYVTYYHTNSEYGWGLDSQSTNVLTSFAFVGFDAASLLSTNGYKKLEDAVIDGKSYYSYEVFIYDYKGADTGSNYIICVDKDSGLWTHFDLLSDDSVTKYHVTSFKNQYDNIFSLADPVMIPEQTLYDAKGIVIRVKDTVTTNPQTAAELVFEVNNTTQKDIKISSHRLQVNGLYLGQNVIQGEIKANSTSEIKVELPVSSLALSDIYSVQEMDTRLKIYATDPEGRDTVLVGDTGDLSILIKNAEEAQPVVPKSGTPVFSENKVKLSFIDLISLPSGSTYFRFYVENEFAELIRIRINITKINGVSVEESNRFRMAACSEGYNGFTLYESDLSQLEEVETIEFDYAVYYGDMDDGGIDYNKTQTLLKSSAPITIAVK